MKKIEKHFIKSSGGDIYVEINYPSRKVSRAPAIIVAHGLRSYYPGFLDIFAKKIREAGYISVKFHFIGTGKSSGTFEEKTTETMLQNYSDVLRYIKSLPEVKSIGIVARSNAAVLATLYGPDSSVKAYAFLAPPAYYSSVMSKFIKNATLKGKFFYHNSFKRPHTKGKGRLPISYEEEMKKYDKPFQRNIKKMKPVIFFQSTKDEAVLLSEGHYDFWKRELSNPRKLILIKGGNHSYKGHKKFVIEESIKWFKKYLPIK